jgi:hypothetical protein
MFRLARRRTLPHQVVAILALAGFVAAHVGFPVIETGGKDTSQPFPCMASACGCRSAEACWRGCCCHTNAEKLAWAKRHGVTPPEFVVAAARKEAGPHAPGEPVSCCAVESAARPAGCCAGKSGTAGSEKTESWRLALVPSIAARKCQGLAQLWLILSAAAPVARPVTCSIDLAVARATPPVADRLLSCDFVPPTPPPRV